VAVRDSGDKELAERRHRALADPSRRELLELLANKPDGLDIAGLASKLGLHANTVRWHLGLLAEAGFVSRDSRAGARGRPALVYRLAPRPTTDPDEHRLLLEILVGALDRSPTADKQAERAGWVRGKALVAANVDAAKVKPAKALDFVVSLMERLGFKPQRGRDALGQRILTRPCPFGVTASDGPSIVCQAHLGLVRGALEELKAPLEPAGIEPFSQPNACIIHLRTRKRRQLKRAS
jgi:predicted ArsR family transcriptional regulator